jgi:hypothetical protein
VDGVARADTAAKALAEASIVALRPAGGGAKGALEADISLGGGAPRRVRVALAQQEQPLAWRRPLAFYRLAQALGARVVPAAAARPLALGEIAALLHGQPGAIEMLRGLPVLNDGTVDAILLAPAPGPPGPRWDSVAQGKKRVLALDDAPEIERWAAWAASPAPAPGERTALVRDYVEALALDYLAGHVLRRAVVLDEAAGALVLEVNEGAFPTHVPAHALDRFLRRLAAVARFPRSLRDGLARLGRAEAARVLAPGAGAAPVPEGFEGWLVPPRTLIELDERRAALITLIEAEIAARGEAAVLSL